MREVTVPLKMMPTLSLNGGHIMFYLEFIVGIRKSDLRAILNCWRLTLLQNCLDNAVGLDLPGRHAQITCHTFTILECRVRGDMSGHCGGCRKIQGFNMDNPAAIRDPHCAANDSEVTFTSLCLMDFLRAALADFMVVIGGRRGVQEGNEGSTKIIKTFQVY
jgi:hypothetical protein